MTWCNPRGLRPCPTALPELFHALNHPGDELSSQFDRILNLSGMFAPLLPLNPSLVFWAPLDYTLNDLRGSTPTFARDTAAVWRRDDGEHFLVPSNQPRFEGRRLLMESESTNKCANYNAEPDSALLNIVKRGDAASILSRVDDSSLLNQAGLSSICSSGLVIQLDNSAGSSWAGAYINPSVGNTNFYSWSAWARKVTGLGLARLRTTDNSLGIDITNFDIYERKSFVGNSQDPSLRLELFCEPGVVARVILNQVEETFAPSSPIITQGAAASRAADSLDYGNLDGWFNQAQGMALTTIVPRFETQPSESGNISLVSTTTDNVTLSYYREPDIQFRVFDGTNNPRVAVQSPFINASHAMATLWSATELTIGTNRNNAGWVWGDIRAYDGAFASNDKLNILDKGDWTAFRARAFHISDIQIWSENKGRAWIEDNYP